MNINGSYDTRASLVASIFDVKVSLGSRKFRDIKMAQIVAVELWGRPFKIMTSDPCVAAKKTGIESSASTVQIPAFVQSWIRPEL